MAQSLKIGVIALLGILAWWFAGRAFLNQTYQSVTKSITKPVPAKSDLHFDRPPEFHFDRGFGNSDKPPPSLAR
jgi:hypothetical protein